MRTEAMRRAALLAAIVLAFTSAGCHKSAAAATPTITISPTDIDLEAGTTEQFGDTIANESTTGVTWQVVTPGGTPVTGGNSTIGTISTAGLYTAPVVPPNPTVVEIIVFVTADTATTATASVTIEPTPVVTLTPATVTLAPSLPAKPYAFDLSLFGLAMGESSAVTWEVNNIPGGNATIGTIDAMGNYTPPQVPPSGGQVFVEVYLDADPTQSAGSTVTLTYAAASMQGSFAFYLAGQNSSGGFFARAGQFVPDGVSTFSGVEDVHTPAGATSQNITGTYTVGADGRGTATLTDGAGTTDYYLAVVSASQVKLSEADNSATAHGEADLQTASSFVQASFHGGYAFDFFGATGAAATSEIGQFTATGALAAFQNGLEDTNAGGVASGATAFTGTFGAINGATGRGTAVINGTLQFSFYMISAGQVRFIETDNSAILVGDAVQQSGTPVAGWLSSLNVFTLTGHSPAGKIAVAGLFFADGAGGTPTSISNGLYDQNNEGTVSAGVQYAGTYGVQASGRGSGSFTAGGQTLKTFVLYFIQPGKAFIQETDSSIVADGIVLAQGGLQGNFSTASLTGSFALNWTGAAPPTTAQQDSTGQLTVGKVAAQVSGTWDRDDALVLAPGITLTGPYFLAVNGRGTITLTDANNVVYDLSAYVVNPNTVYLVGTDPALVFAGQLTRQF
jgi:hypothetical protein